MNGFVPDLITGDRLISIAGEPPERQRESFPERAEPTAAAQVKQSPIVSGKTAPKTSNSVPQTAPTGESNEPKPKLNSNGAPSATVSSFLADSYNASDKVGLTTECKTPPSYRPNPNRAPPLLTGASEARAKLGPLAKHPQARSARGEAERWHQLAAARTGLLCRYGQIGVTAGTRLAHLIANGQQLTVPQRAQPPAVWGERSTAVRCRARRTAGPARGCQRAPSIPLL